METQPTNLAVGTRVRKLTNKPFKSTYQVNTITGFVINEQDPKKREAAVFAEDDSVVNLIQLTPAE